MRSHRRGLLFLNLIDSHVLFGWPQLHFLTHTHRHYLSLLFNEQLDFFVFFFLYILTDINQNFAILILKVFFYTPSASLDVRK